MFTVEDEDNISRYDLVHAFAHGVPGVGDVGDAVPGHGAELDHHEHQRQHVLLPPEGGAEGQHEGHDHHDGRDGAGLGEHTGQLLHRTHQEECAAMQYLLSFIEFTVERNMKWKLQIQ